MSNILINKEELDEAKEALAFLKTLSSDMQERLKTVIWWESMRKNEETPKGA